MVKSDLLRSAGKGRNLLRCAVSICLLKEKKDYNLRVKVIRGRVFVVAPQAGSVGKAWLAFAMRIRKVMQ